MNPSQNEYNRYNSLRLRAGFVGFALKKRGRVYIVSPQSDPSIQMECYNLDDVVKYIKKKTGMVLVTKWD